MEVEGGTRRRVLEDYSARRAWMGLRAAAWRAAHPHWFTRVTFFSEKCQQVLNHTLTPLPLPSVQLENSRRQNQL
jgi:hypothetical protein